MQKKNPFSFHFRVKAKKMGWKIEGKVRQNLVSTTLSQATI